MSVTPDDFYLLKFLQAVGFVLILANAAVYLSLSSKISKIAKALQDNLKTVKAKKRTV